VRTVLLGVMKTLIKTVQEEVQKTGKTVMKAEEVQSPVQDKRTGNEKVVIDLIATDTDFEEISAAAFRANTTRKSAPKSATQLDSESIPQSASTPPLQSTLRPTPISRRRHLNPLSPHP
jgi:hypothetical protein